MSTGERIVLRDRQHWFVVAANARYGVAAIVAAIVILLLQAVANASGALADLLGLVVVVLFVGGLVQVGWEILRYQNQEYLITNRRVIQVSGVINKRSGDSSLEKINDADLSQSVFGRMFNFGDLDILTASDAGIDRLRMIHDPVGFKRSMLDAKHEYEQDMARGPGSVSPPLRATPEPRPAERPVERPVAHDPDPTSSTPVGGGVPPAGPAPAPAAVQSPPAAPPAAEPAAPAKARMSADEVTRTLASLADLRDRGALSAEEYEQKKAELLGRL